MPSRDIIVIGASADGVQMLKELVRPLPRDLPAALFVVLHTGPGGGTVLPGILSRAGKLPAEVATDGARVHHGRIYVAPADFHLLPRALHAGLVGLSGAYEQQSDDLIERAQTIRQVLEKPIEHRPDAVEVPAGEGGEA